MNKNKIKSPLIAILGIYTVLWTEIQCMQQNYTRNEKVHGTRGMIVTGVDYIIKNNDDNVLKKSFDFYPRNNKDVGLAYMVSSGNYSETNSNEHTFKLVHVSGDRYAIKSSSYGYMCYLTNGNWRGSKDIVLDEYLYENQKNYFNYKLIYSNNGFKIEAPNLEIIYGTYFKGFRLRKEDSCRSSGGFVFSFIPQNYEINASVYKFDFGSPNLHNILKRSKLLEFVSSSDFYNSSSSTSISSEFSYSKSCTSSFTLGFSQSIGVDFNCTFNAPLLASSGISVKTNFAFNQSYTTSETKNYSAKFQFNIDPGKSVCVSGFISSYQDVVLPFTALVKYSANLSGKLVSSAAVRSFLNHEGIQINIVKEKGPYVIARISGTLTGSYGMKTVHKVKKIK